MRRIGERALMLAGAMLALVGAEHASAFQGLPAGGQVNDDPAAKINKAQGTSGEDPTNADVVGGAVTEGKPAVPWAIFRHHEESPADQIFVRSFAGGAWTTRGSGTVGGRSSGPPSPTLPASLNFDQEEDGEAPAIDFAGTGRTVPWAAWYEETYGENPTGENFEATNIFASRFDSASDKWIFGGQGRGLGEGEVRVPSLNIHTEQGAENPSVAGGSAGDPTKPGPWVTWQEKSVESNEPFQIFAERPEGPGKENCDTVTPQGVSEGLPKHIPAIGGFCWQQVGVQRYGGDPTLNIDPTRNGIEPDIAFAGIEDKVPWVVWYETEKSKVALKENELVLAARAVKNKEGEAEPGDGGFHWEAVGRGTTAAVRLDATGPNKFGTCAESISIEAQCALNNDPNKDAEDPRAAAGTMSSANPTVPWVAWDEEFEGSKRIFVSRLVAGTHFELANNGMPISGPNATRPDITFSANTPYVSWRQDTSPGVTRGFYGHFIDVSNPTFVLDESNVPLTPSGKGLGQADVREPISSGCIATPFNADGSACQGGAVGTPFFLFTNGTNPLGLFADGYQPETPVTGGSSRVSSSSAIVSGTVNPLGASVNVFFEYGTTTAYGAATGVLKTGPEEGTGAFTATLAGLPSATTIHYRAVAVSDFGKFFGSDQAFTTASSPPPPPDGKASFGHASVSDATVGVRVTCEGVAGSKCELTFELTARDTFRGHRLVAITPRPKLRRNVVVVGSATVTLNAGESRTVQIPLNDTGERLLVSRHKLKVKLRITQTLANGDDTVLLTRTLTIKAPKHRRR
jgi:hypothetical protein